MKTKPTDETQEILTTISRFLKNYRWQLGLSQKELADIAMISHNTVSRIENNRCYNIASLIEICLALDLPLRELFWEL